MAYLYDIALSFLYRTRLRKALALVEQYGSAEEAWRHLDEADMSACLVRAEQEAEWIEAHGIRVWTLANEDYPYRLRQCPDKPLLLYGKGNLHPSDGHIVSIVGTRKPTERGKELTDALVRELHERLEHVTIVSGGAYGIDIAAHRAAFQYGVPTIIVPAHGLDRIYPYQHRADAIKALENGMACDYSRDLFTFPGRPSDVSSQGCNHLIRRQKAQLITCADDLIDAMNWTKRNTPSQPVQTQLIGLRDDLTAEQQALLTKLQEAEEGLHINLLVMETERPYSDVSADLVMLELDGLVRSLPGGIYRFQR